MAEAFLAGLIGFLIGRGIEPKDATAVVEALRTYLGFEPPLGLTGYALDDIAVGKEAKASVVVRGKAYDVVSLGDIVKYQQVSILGKKGDLLEVAPTMPLATTTSSTKWTKVAGNEQIIVTALGAGRNVFMGFDSDYDGMTWTLRADGARLFPFSEDLSAIRAARWEEAYGAVGQPSGIILTKRDTVNNKYAFAITLPIEWKRKLEIGAYSADASLHNVGASIIWTKTLL